MDHVTEDDVEVDDVEVEFEEEIEGKQCEKIEFEQDEDFVRRLADPKLPKKGTFHTGIGVRFVCEGSW